VKDGAEDFKNLWKEGGPDPFDDVPAAVPKVKRETARAREEKEQNYLHENMDEIAVGVNAASLVWLRLLQLRRMRSNEKYLLLSNKWLEQYGVDRWAKGRALAAFKRRGLINTARSNAGNTRVAVIPRSKRRVAKPQQRRSKSATGRS